MNKSRIAVLVVALGAGGIAARLAISQPPPPVPQAPVQKVEAVDVLVAKSDIRVGQSVGASDVEWRPWPVNYVSSQFIQRPQGSNSTDDVAGSIARAPFVAGEPIRQAKLIKANSSGYMAAVLPPGMRAVSTEITPESGAGGFILPNDRVDVILTGAHKEGNKEYYKTQTILTDVRVLAIDQTVEEKGGQKTVMGKIATLELSPGEAEKLALARRLGTISLTLRGLTESAQSVAKNDKIGYEEPITIVRFGQAAPN